MESDGSAYIFATSRALTHRLYSTIESKLDAKGEEIDVLHVHGRLPKQTKFDMINIFCRNMSFDGFNPRVLVATCAADIGVDCPDANHVMNIEWVHNISSWIQRMGRRSRHGQRSVIINVAGVSSYISMMMRIYRNRNPSNDDGAEDCLEAFSTLIRSPSIRNVSSAERRYVLSKADQTESFNNQLAEFADVLNLFCLNKGCIHRRLEIYQHLGCLSEDASVLHNCKNMCLVCDGDWDTIFRPVRRDGLLMWFDSIEGFPCKATVNNIMDKIWSQPHYMLAIFDRKSGICKYHVKALIMQLIAASLLGVELVNGQLSWVIKKFIQSHHLRQRRIGLINIGMELTYRMVTNGGNIMSTK